MMIGVSMAAAMIICIAAFIWLYVQIGPLLSDFIPQEPAEEPPGTTGILGAAGPTPATGNTGTDDFTLDEIPPEPIGTPEEGEDWSAINGLTDDEDEGDDDVEDDAWVATHQIREGPNVNFRSGPNTISEPQGALAPGSLLQFLGDEEPSGGVVWMNFEIEDGTQGWIRDIDVIEVENQTDDDDETDEEDDTNGE